MYLERGIRYDARVYLNGGGTDPELRFYVWDWGREFSRFPCPTCDGKGRRERAQTYRPEKSFLDVLDQIPDDQWDPVDDAGLAKKEPKKQFAEQQVSARWAEIIK
jgi:hypothetical protein